MVGPPDWESFSTPKQAQQQATTGSETCATDDVGSCESSAADQRVPALEKRSSHSSAAAYRLQQVELNKQSQADKPLHVGTMYAPQRVCAVLGGRAKGTHMLH